MARTLGVVTNLQRRYARLGAPSTVYETVGRGACFMATWKPGDPSPYVSPYMSRRQAEELLALIRAQPQKKWRAVEKNLLQGLRRNANGKKYPDYEQAKEEGR